VKRRVGPKRAPGSREGLTRRQAEAELRNLIGSVQPKPRAGVDLTIADAAKRYIVQAERRGRKRSTTANIESETRVHLEPFFGERSIDSIRQEDVEGLIGVMEGKGRSPKTVRNVVATLSALLGRYAASNPCEGLELPAVPEQTEIRFLTPEEVDAVVRHARPGMYQAIDRALFLTAAMTGLRKGELIALRWRDVDWTAARIRVRQNYVRGEFGTPKSKRSTRSVPMADEVGGALERLFKRSRFQGDGDLVFAHPASGEPLPEANVTRRFRKALKAARLDSSHRFHDLRHTFGTRMAAAGAPMRELQEWMGHRDLATTQIYADYSPSGRESELVARAFARGSIRGTNLSESDRTSDDLKVPNSRGNAPS
jgi:integrase